MDSKQTESTKLPSERSAALTTDGNSVTTTCKPISGKDIINIRIISGRSINSTGSSSPPTPSSSTACVRPTATVLKPTGTMFGTTSGELTAESSSATTTAANPTIDPEANTSNVMLTTSSTKIAKTSKIKFLVLGAAQVGKTLILRRMQNNNWSLVNSIATYKPTVGPDLHRLKCGTIEAIDIGGQERYMSIARKYCELFTLFVIVFDITDAETFLMARYWLDFINSKTSSISVKRILLIGNKTDLKSKRKVSMRLARNLAMTYKANYMEISAKMDLTMDKVLEELETKKTDQ